MTVDLPAAAAFLATHARVLDRRRFELAAVGLAVDPVHDLAPAIADAVLAAVDGYRNADGGYGWGLEPDLRSPGSQPGGALHAFEVFEDVTPVTTPRAVELCDWLASVASADGGLPFALPIPTGTEAGCAPLWAQTDPSSSLQITAAVAAAAHRVARHDRTVAEHPWLVRATDYCLGAAAALGDAAPHAYVLSFTLQFLDVVHDSHPSAPALLARLAKHVPSSGMLPVEGGSADEVLRPLDVAPVPGRPVRAAFSPGVIAADLRRLAGQQQADGGWPVEFASYSPAATLEWRGHATVRAVSLLRRNLALG